MKCALATHVLWGYPENRAGASTPETRRNLLAWARRHGFDGIDVGAWWFDFYGASIAETRRLREQINDLGLQMVAFNCLQKTVVHPTVAETNRRDLRRAVEVAGEVGVPFVSVSLSLGPAVVGLTFDQMRGVSASPGGSRDATEDDVRATAAFLGDLARQAAAAGVQIALELHNCSLADTSRSLLRLLDLADQPNLSANPDVGNVYWAYETPEESWQEALARLAPRTRFWHVKNVQRVHIPEVGRACFVQAPLDSGDVDYRWALARMIEAGFDGWISIEGAAGAGDWLAFAARGKRYLDELLDDLAAGVGLAVQ